MAAGKFKRQKQQLIMAHNVMILGIHTKYGPQRYNIRHTHEIWPTTL